ncbi:MAG: hypothetical protein IIA73_10955 [Proteobacteria bacterium]|nr:hypothetical protein [Pseudomonadota bacterium]
MSVIPLTTEGQYPTVVTNKDEFKRDGNAILIMPLDKKQLSPDSKDRNSVYRNDCNSCYDLRVGPLYFDHRNAEDDGGRELGERGAINILPGMAVIIQTEEEVRFPKTAFGQIVPRIYWLQKGLSNTPSKVDPGYEGHLLITVFNHGKRSVPLKRRERFCSFYAMTVGEQIRPYEGKEKKIGGRGTMRPWQRLRDRLEANISAVTALLMIVVAFNIILSIISITLQFAGTSLSGLAGES